MRDLSAAFAVVGLAGLVAACTFTSSGAGGPGATAVQSSSDGPQNGHATSPGRVDCSLDGNTTCGIGSQVCCGGAGPTDTCQQSGGSQLCNGGGQWMFQCDEAADCANGQVCCLVGNTFSCAQTCSPSQQSCRLNSECGTGNTCTVQACNGGIFTELCAAGNGCSAE